MSVLTQVRISFSGVVGLDYTALQTTANILKIDLTEARFYHITQCEQLMLKIYNE